MLVVVTSCGPTKNTMVEEKQATIDEDGWKSNEIYFRAIGTEPFWSVTIADDFIEWSNPTEKVIFVGTNSIQAMDANVKKYNTTNAQGKRLEVQIIQKKCSDGMSDDEHAYEVTLNFPDTNQEPLKGCGNYILPKDLIGTWELLHMEETNLTNLQKNILLELHDDFTFTGNATCNRYFGKLFNEKKLLRLETIGSTKIACSEKEIEYLYLDYLQKITHFSRKKNELILLNDSGLQLKFTKVNTSH